MRYSLFCLIIVFASLNLRAQGPYIPLGSYSMHILDRMEIKQGRLATPFEFNTTTKAYKRQSIARFVDSFNVSNTVLSEQDFFNLAYLQNDNFEYTSAETTRSRRRLGKSALFMHKAAALDYVNDDIALVVNPVTYQKIEYDQNLGKTLWYNNKGAEIRGHIGNQFSFYTTVTDVIHPANTWDLAFYVNDSVIPGQAFLKTADDRSFNYLQASGYAVWQAGKYFDVQFGHGRNFLGNGYRSLFMSDFSRDHLFLRANTRFWKINYTNIWGQLYDYVRPGQRRLPKRHYYAATHMNMNITSKFQVGLFQAISFQRDSGYDNPGYDAQYLNPIIFYKPIENGLNSPDKTILGADFKYNFARHFSLYGQVVLTEFIFEQIISRNGWAGNKNGFQLGAKYIDMFGIRNLDAQLEFNRVRPYTYTSFEPKNAYVNYNQNMAHPFGANFKEWIGILRYQPTQKSFITAKTIFIQTGLDTGSSNWGSNIREPYFTFERETGNVVGQGVKTTYLISEFVFSYMVKHNLFVDVQFTYRNVTSDWQKYESQTFNPAIAIRWNIAHRPCDY